MKACLKKGLPFTQHFSSSLKTVKNLVSIFLISIVSQMWEQDQQHTASLCLLLGFMFLVVTKVKAAALSSKFSLSAPKPTAYMTPKPNSLIGMTSQKQVLKATHSDS